MRTNIVCGTKLQINKTKTLQRKKYIDFRLLLLLSLLSNSAGPYNYYLHFEIINFVRDSQLTVLVCDTYRRNRKFNNQFIRRSKYTYYFTLYVFNVDINQLKS